MQLTEDELRSKIKLIIATHDIVTIGLIMMELRHQYIGEYDIDMAYRIIVEEI